MDEHLRDHERLLARQGIDAIVLDRQKVIDLLQEVYYTFGPWAYRRLKRAWEERGLPELDIELKVRCSGGCGTETLVYDYSDYGQLTHVGAWLCIDCQEHTSFEAIDASEEAACESDNHNVGLIEVEWDGYIPNTILVPGCLDCGEAVEEPKS